MSGITLANVGGDGAAEELFQEQLAAVLADIADPNAKAKAKREITLKVVFPVDEDRTFFAPEIHVARKLAPREPVRGPYVEMGTDIHGKPEATQRRGPEQGRLEFPDGGNGGPDEPEWKRSVEIPGPGGGEKVVEMKKKGGWE